MRRAPIPNDPRLVTKCRFKSRPETEKEKADCKSTLLGPDTAKIAACRFLDYGQVALGQCVARLVAQAVHLLVHADGLKKDYTHCVT